MSDTEVALVPMVSVVARLWFKTKASLVALSTFNLIMALEAVPQW